MGVSRSGFYKWRERIKSPSDKKKVFMANLTLFKEYHEKYPSHGYRWLNSKIKLDTGYKMSDPYAHKCCKILGIKSKSRHYRYRKPGNPYRLYPNIISSEMNIDGPLQCIVSDMTAFYVKGIYYELTMYFDAWNKEILGYGLTNKKGAINSYHDGLNQVLKRIKKEQTDELIILHTDQGSVYSSKAYNKLLDNYNIQRSMSRAGTPTDNPVNESLNGWIKEELIVDFDLKHSSDVPKLIEEYINYYNNERPSYALNYKTPIQYKIESGFSLF